jgi:hypothetical protein
MDTSKLFNIGGEVDFVGGRESQPGVFYRAARAFAVGAVLILLVNATLDAVLDYNEKQLKEFDRERLVERELIRAQNQRFFAEWEAR